MPWLLRLPPCSLLLVLSVALISSGGSRGIGSDGTPTSPIQLLPLAIDTWETGHELPDVVAGRVFGGHIFVRVHNGGGTRLRDVVLRVKGSAYLEGTSGMAIELAPGQRSSVHAPLVQRGDVEVTAESCPLRVQLRVEVGGELAASTKHRLLCRTLQDRFSFVYLDADGSPQMAAAKFPIISPKYNGSSCPTQGCAVLLSTHGMDVTAQRQADCYRPKRGMWVLAPHGRGTHGFNWQGPGHWSALHALRSLEERAALWPHARVVLATEPHHRVVFTGHSNGGFGAWFFGTHYPDLAAGVAPLAGMATMGTTEVRRPGGLHDALWAMIHSSVEEYRGEELAPNLLGTPFLARAGSADRVIDPRATRHMVALLRDAGVHWTEKSTRHGTRWVGVSPRGSSATVVEVAGKEHWWWDTKETNDGGVMDDVQMRRFWKTALNGTTGSARDGDGDAVHRAEVRFTCANLASCGSSLGVRLLQQQRPGVRSSFRLWRSRDATGGGVRWQLQTENVARLRVDVGAQRAAEPHAEVVRMEVDGQIFNTDDQSGAGGASATPSLAQAVSVLFCRNDAKPADPATEWQRCGSGAEEGSAAETCPTDAARASDLPECCHRPLRSADVEMSSGPIRRVLSAPFAIVYGTGAASPDVAVHYQTAAVAFANAWSAVAGGVTSIIADGDFDAGTWSVPGSPESPRNLVLFGGVYSNSVARALAPQQPVRALEMSPEQASGRRAGRRRMRLEGGFGIGDCEFGADGTGLVSLGPRHQMVPEQCGAEGAGSDNGLVVTVAGTTLEGFDKAVELFRSHLFDTNSWQHRLPDYVVAGPGFVKGQGVRTLKGVVAAGYWGNRWEYRDDASFAEC